ncbi:PhaM family polyhydroxyalkanoate granule multifunctional regulatory protein [Castellaniella sp.]|uniref:PhaM family polyhydroxyalkanoate granule multifunctional regulatory protein n=1 Tax=Castellaniella sp. TaxID=1955812 RepID=UPI002AFF4819|nr:PhaM family polyhydroxyalkanoate granule multifunctional regulatory protein [Castellaniella sp.]
MAQESPNPFVLPGFGQQGEAAGNPLFAGLDMMRQAWQNLAGRMDTPAMPAMSLEDLDRRIRELQTVQNWLQLNATMLANTIQGMEIQRSTLKTLQSFAGGVFPGAAAKSAKSAGSAKSAQTAAGAQADEAGQAYAQAAGDWWNMVQQQFEQLREATTASLGSMAEAADAASAAAAKKPARATARKAAASAASPGKTSKAAGKAAGRATRKPRA